MARVRIPAAARSGFEAISKLSEEQVNAIADYLDKMPVGTRMEDIEAFLSSNLNIQQSPNIVYTFRSFAELLQPANVDPDVLAEKLTSSYKEQVGQDFSEIDENNLRKNLGLIFNHSINLKLTLKAYDLIGDTNYIFTGSKIISDIRLVFNDNIETKDVKRNALIVHQMHFEYYKERNRRIEFKLDLSDLKKIKADIERAINKEDVIKKDYSEVFNFLNLRSDEEL